METNVEKTVTTTLILTEEERDWLKGIIQNTVGGCAPIDEDQKIER